MPTPRTSVAVRVLAFAVACLVSVSAAQAIDASGTVTGIVRDPSGAVVVGADVALLTAQQTNVHGTRTGPDGRFTFERVSPGRYVLLVSFAGFADRRTPVHVSGTAPTMAGIYVRGLTGNKVNIFVDGVRYSNSAQRGGVNTFLDLIEPTSLQAIEVLRGPNSAQYGSDAMGGSVQFLSQVPSLASPGGRAWRGNVGMRAGSADRSTSLNLGAAYSAGKWGMLVNGAARNVEQTRPGKGIDSHAAVTRFFGLSSGTLMDERLPGTEFVQYGAMMKINWTPTSNGQFVFNYTRSQQDDGKRYDQLLGGDGNLIADLRNLMLDFFYVKYNRADVGPFDQVTAVYSFNTQREERVNQGGNGNPTASITHEYERM